MKATMNYPNVKLNLDYLKGKHIISLDNHSSFKVDSLSSAVMFHVRAGITGLL